MSRKPNAEQGPYQVEEYWPYRTVVLPFYSWEGHAMLAKVRTEDDVLVALVEVPPVEGRAFGVHAPVDRQTGERHISAGAPVTLFPGRRLRRGVHRLRYPVEKPDGVRCPFYVAINDAGCLVSDAVAEPGQERGAVRDLQTILAVAERIAKRREQRERLRA